MLTCWLRETIQWIGMMTMY
uniref:Uncharacterized protein n=1 Tax=Arundo donax TaxID=35708 RepID=A0A0A9HIB7_ARUDO